MKGYKVFNVEQIEGLPEIYYAKAVPTHDPIARTDHAETFFGSLGATIRHGGNRAYYAQELDYVQMPPFEAFRDAESYYATRFIKKYLESKGLPYRVRSFHRDDEEDFFLVQYGVPESAGQ